MNALILSCGTGGGHNSAGKAILEELQKRGHQAVMVNPFTLRSNRLASVIDKAYISMVQSAPHVFGAIYRVGNWYRRLPFPSPVYFANGAMLSTMKEYLIKNPADVVIMTHLFPAEILTNMKNHGVQIPKTLFVATDYVCIPFTEETDCDAYIIPASDLADDFINRGIPREKLYPLGIPVQNKFSSAQTRSQAKLHLGLKPDKKYILIAGGSMGGGEIGKVIKTLIHKLDMLGDTELIIVCGSNVNLYQKLTNYKIPGVTVVGYTDDMEMYMKASHLFITKPGGLSSTEAAVSGIPILHTGTIPGCETLNAKYFSQHGMSMTCKPKDDKVEIVHNLLNDDTMYNNMIEKQRNCINRNAVSDICNLAENIIIQENVT